MKKLLITLAITLTTLIGFGQMPTLYFKITVPVITTDGRTINSGAVTSFSTHPESINNGIMPCDLKWWASSVMQDSSYANIIPVTELFNGTVLTVAYLAVTVPPQQFSYTVFQGWAKSWLENKYGVGNVVILN